MRFIPAARAIRVFAFPRSALLLAATRVTPSATDLLITAANALAESDDLARKAAAADAAPKEAAAIESALGCDAVRGVASRWASSSEAPADPPSVAHDVLRAVSGTHEIAWAVLAGVHDASRLRFGGAHHRKIAAISDYSLRQFEITHDHMSRGLERDPACHIAYQRAAQLVERATALAGVPRGSFTPLGLAATRARATRAWLPPHLAAVLDDLIDYAHKWREARV